MLEPLRRADFSGGKVILQVGMRALKEDLGEITRNKVETLRSEMLLDYERWIDRAKSRGEFKPDSSREAAALYCDVQNGSAMRMQREGVRNETIGQAMPLRSSTLFCLS